MRPIDANALWEGEFIEEENEYQRGWNDALRGAQHAAPTIDAVEVTRCKDCRHCEIVDETQRYFCRRPLGTIGYVPVQPDDYCSYAVARAKQK